jgi:hypothetical protein
MALQDYVSRVLELPDVESRRQKIYDFDFARLHQSLVQGVGTIAGCFHCLAACPVGSGVKGKIK